MPYSGQHHIAVSPPFITSVPGYTFKTFTFCPQQSTAQLYLLEERGEEVGELTNKLPRISLPSTLGSQRKDAHCLRTPQYRIHDEKFGQPFPWQIISQVLYNKPLLIQSAPRRCSPGGLPGVFNGAVDDARCMWVHYSESGWPLLLGLLLLLILGL